MRPTDQVALTMLASAMGKSEAQVRVAKLEAENAKLRAFILSLDGKMICIMGDGDTVIDDGIVVASDILNSA